MRRASRHNMVSREVALSEANHGRPDNKRYLSSDNVKVVATDVARLRDN
jgi:hypothetical protein